MKPLVLSEFLEQAEDTENTCLALKASGSLPPKVLTNLHSLQKLSLLTDEAVFSLLGQAPIDPLGLFGAFKDKGVWAFQPHDFSVIQILAKSGAKPVALMQLDLISDDLVFVVFANNQLVKHSELPADQIVAKMGEPEMNEDKMLAWIQTFMRDAIDTGLKNAGG